MMVNNTVPRLISSAEWITYNGPLTRSWNIKLYGLMYEQFETISIAFPEAVFRVDTSRKE